MLSDGDVTAANFVRTVDVMTTLRRVALVISALGCLLAICACGVGDAGTRAAEKSGAQAGDSAARTYRDPTGWAIKVPARWHVVHFNDSVRGTAAAGALISNVSLAAPALVPGYPIQVNDQALPSRGVGLIIATDSRQEPSAAPVTPPLPSPDAPQSRWVIGSALPGVPYLETLRFRDDGKVFIASAKIGSDAENAGLIWPQCDGADSS